MMNNLYLLLLWLFLLSGCGGSSSGSKKHIDIANYLNSTNISKKYSRVYRVNGDLNNSEYIADVLVESNLITIKENGILQTMISVSADEINLKEMLGNSRNKIFKREVAIGDVISTSLYKEKPKILTIGSQRVGEENRRVKEECVLEDLVNSYEIFFYAYKNYDDEHDILKIKCTSKSSLETEIDVEYVDVVSYSNGLIKSKDNISYEYYQKNLGLIAKIDDDCLVSKLPDVIDDTLDKSECLGERYHYTLYHPQY